MIDLHCHLLPGVDDGPADLDEAEAMARAAAEDGVDTVVTTPHQRSGEWVNDDPELLRKLLLRLQGRLDGRPALLLGGEVRVDSELLAELDGGAGRTVLPLAGSSYLLLEFDAMGYCPDPRELSRELILLGWRPVIAHAERVPWLSERPDMLFELVDLGAHIQITTGSVLGAMGRGPQQCCALLLDNELAHFLASDAHDLRMRPPGLSAAARRIARRWGEAMAERLTVTNPRAVLDDRPLPGSVEDARMQP